MKKHLLFFTLVFTIGQLFAQIVNIPDPEFKHYLVHYLGYDTNGNGEIEVIEAETVTGAIDVQGNPYNYGEIEDMTGIEAFVNATALYCGLNLINNLDLSQNLALEIVSCRENNLNSLPLGQNLVLSELDCAINNLTSLDVSQHTGLEKLRCNANSLNTLDVTLNTALTTLYCDNNNLTSLDISQIFFLEHLGCSYNQLTGIVTSNNQILKTLGCNENQIEILDVTQNQLLYALTLTNNNVSNIDLSQCGQLERIGGGGNQIENIDLSSNPKLTLVEFENGNLSSMDFRNANNGIIYHFDTTGNPNLTCIFVDDATWSTANWTSIDSTSTFVETQAECDALGIEDEFLSLNVQIYPNPVIDQLFINGNHINILSIQIYDVIGKLVSQELNNYEKIDVSNLNLGVYLVKIETDRGVFTKKVIKE